MKVAIPKSASKKTKSKSRIMTDFNILVKLSKRSHDINIRKGKLLSKLRKGTLDSEIIV